MSKASDKSLGELHGILAQTLAKGIIEGEDVVTKDGEVVRKSASPALLSVARQFLKDNHIEASAGNKDMSVLEKAMQDMAELPYEGEKANH